MPATDVDLLDLGVQDTGTFGSAWALEVRGARPAGPDDLLLAWTIRGAPHAYRRRDVSRGHRRHRAVLRGRRGGPGLRRVEAAPRGRGRRARRAEDRGTPHARHRPSTPAEGRRVEPAQRAPGPAVPALLPVLRCDPQLRADVPAGRPAGRAGAGTGHVAAGPAPHPRPPGDALPAPRNRGGSPLRRHPGLPALLRTSPTEGGRHLPRCSRGRGQGQHPRRCRRRQGPRPRRQGQRQEGDAPRPGRGCRGAGRRRRAVR